MATNYPWTIEHSGNEGSTWTDITNYVQTFSYRYGRQRVSDQWASGRGGMDGVYPASLPTIDVGDWVRIKEPTNGVIYLLAVSDYSRMFSPAGADADRWEMTLEDAFAQLGRIYLDSDSTTVTGIDPPIAAWGVATTYGVDFDYYGTGNSTVDIPAQTKGTSGAAIINNLINQAGAYMQTHRVDLGSKYIAYDSLPYTGDPDNLFTNTTWSDDGGANDFEYQQLEFQGLADSYFDRIFVVPATIAAEEAGTGLRAYQQNTFHETATQANDWADFLLLQLGSPALCPTVLQSSTAAQKGARPALLDLLPGNTVTVQLRGTDYYGMIEGGAVNITPANTKITLYLSDRSQLNFLLLDDTVFGKLDENRLGF